MRWCNLKSGVDRNYTLISELPFSDLIRDPKFSQSLTQDRWVDRRNQASGFLLELQQKDAVEWPVIGQLQRLGVNQEN